MKQTLKVSQFETILPLPGDDSRALAVNGLYGAMDVIPAEAGRLLEQSGNQAALSGSLSGDLEKRLALRGHLVPGDGDWERENAALLSRLHWLVPYRRFVDIVIMPTYNCNFRCGYCFERARLDRGPEWLARSMSAETLDALFRQLDAFGRRGISVRKMVLYGGEPLLRVNRPLVAEIIRRSAERGIRLIAVTNGYDLDHFIDLFPEDLTDFLQITVDGPAPVHDSRRFLAGGQGTFERIMRNIALALEHRITVNVRTNVHRANLKDAFSLMEDYRARGLTGNPYFHFYYKATLGCFEDDPANAISDEELFHALLDAGLDRKQAISLSRVHQGMAHFTLEAFKKEGYPQIRPAFCGAHSDMIVVDPDGTLYACWDMVSMEEHSVGFLDAESGKFMYNFNFPKWRTRTVDRMPDCRDCPVSMLCGGGCSVESDGTYGDRNRGFCGSMKEAVRDVLPLYCAEEYARTGESALTLSFYDLIRGLTAEERKELLTTTDSGWTWEIAKKYLNQGRKIFV